MNQCLNSFFYDLGSILDPQMTPKSRKKTTFSYSSVPRDRLGSKRVAKPFQDSPKGPKGSPNPSKTAQRVRFYRFRYYF